MTTPAPTLEELPLQKGSILELHSIGEEYDGTIVEYLKTDKENPGKIFVLFLDDDDMSKTGSLARPSNSPDMGT